jgi:hypothetical protein
LIDIKGKKSNKEIINSMYDLLLKGFLYLNKLIKAYCFNQLVL